MITREIMPLPPRIFNKSGTPCTFSDTRSTILDPVHQQFTTHGQKPCNGLKRWYEPTTGKWHSNDPIGISGGLNQYVFCANNPVNFLDPDGQYGSNVHLNLTQQWALEAGLGEAAAQAIAAANEGLDHGPTSPLPATRQGRRSRQLHFMQHGGYDARPMLRRMAREAADECDTERFGRVLHMLQDTYSHEGYGPKVGHFFAGTAPDVYDPNSVRDQTMEADTRNLLEYWQAHAGK